ncbi:MAG: hypothetical protein ACK5D5_03490 [Bacteroidota bacterium]|jgi:hypothetical protein
MTDFDADIIVVGSGCSGAMAAQTLAEGGLKVLMLDVGSKNDEYEKLIPNKDFENILETEENQHEYFLGRKFESLNFGETSSGAQLTPPRKHLTRYVSEFLKTESDSFFPVESLAYGGLGAGWGLGCCVYSEEEMSRCNLDYLRMNSAYEVIAERIGISADSKDNASSYTIGNVSSHLKPLRLDESKYLQDRFSENQNNWNKKGIFLGRPALALLSEDYKNRKACTYDDMHFYRDAGNSAYRPGLTIDELKSRSKFLYNANQLVLKFSEKDGIVEVETWDVILKEKKTYSAKKLVLASGALSTARIVLRSFDSSEKISFLCNPYTYYPCLNFRLTGKKIMRNKTGLAQLSVFHDKDLFHDDIAMASIYSYRSLFLFRLMNNIPLNYQDGKELIRFLLSGMVIMGIHHPDSFDNNRFLERKVNQNSLTGDDFKMEFTLDEERKNNLIQREKLFKSLMRSLGAWALKRVDPGMGSSIHYAGTLPFNDSGKKFTLGKNGRLNGTQSVFVADSSGFNYLPAKGLTFSLMANAHTVAENILQNQ